MASFSRVFFMFLTLAGSLVLAKSIGFQGGQEWQMKKRSGVVRYACFNGILDEPQKQICNGLVIEPNANDYFYHPSLPKGNLVRLSVSHEEGVRTQVRGWNRITGNTIEPFELFNITLERRSLLTKGKNRIDYQILQNAEVITTGHFEVTVSQVTQKCASRYLGVSSALVYGRCIHDERICKEYLEDFASCSEE